MHYQYMTYGTCSAMIDFDLEDGIVRNVRFFGGCGGNTQGVAKLVEGMRAEEVISRLQGIDCGGKGTSCPDQLARAIQQAMEK